MNADDVNRIYNLFALVEQCGGRLEKAGSRVWASPCPMCGGDDRFTLKETPAGWRWHCRQCGDGKYHGAIDFMMQYGRCDFKTALTALGGVVVSPSLVARARKAPEPVTLPPEDWQREAWHLAFKASDNLRGALGEPGRLYLAGRGLKPDTWNAWLLGFDRLLKGWVISIPNIDGDGNMLSLKYRYIDRLPSGERYTAFKGSKNLIYGLGHLSGGDTLIICEGEINTLSIWQERPAGVDVLSSGSETVNDQAAAVFRLLGAKYRRVVVWYDESDKARNVGKRVGAVKAFSSAEAGGLDANAFLQVAPGLLGSFLVELLRW